MSSKKREKELEEIKTLLLDERKKIIESMEGIERDSEEELEQMGGDMADYASVESSKTTLAKIGSRQKKLLEKIDYALQKFEDGSFGVCEHTGEEIPIARLRVRPVTKYTVEAQEELERRERGFAKHDADEENNVWEEDDEIDE